MQIRKIQSRYTLAMISLMDAINRRSGRICAATVCARGTMYEVEVVSATGEPRFIVCEVDADGDRHPVRRDSGSCDWPMDEAVAFLTEAID